MDESVELFVRLRLGPGEHRKTQASIAQRKPKLPVDESGVLELRAATLYLLQ